MTNPMGKLRPCQHCGGNHYSNSAAGRQCAQKNSKNGGSSLSAESAVSDFLSQEQQGSRTPEQTIEYIEDVASEIEVDLWDGSSNINDVFEDIDDLVLIDYNDELVDFQVNMIVKDKESGEYYSSTIISHSGIESTPLMTTPVTREVKTVKETEVWYMDGDDSVMYDPPLSSSFHEFISGIDRKDDSYINLHDVYSTSDESTGRHFFRVINSQERSVTDIPSDIDVDIHMWHNNQFQNAREYKTACVYVDEKLRRGFVVMGQDSSENGGSMDYVQIDGGTLKVNPKLDDTFTGWRGREPVNYFRKITLNGNTSEATYYKEKK